MISPAEVIETENWQKKRSWVCFVTKLKNSERCYTILSILSDHLYILLFTEKNKDIVKSAYNEWLDKYEEFLLSHDEVRAWLSQSEHIFDEEHFLNIDEKRLILKESVE